MDTGKIEGLFLQYEALQASIAPLKAEETRLKDEIRKELDALHVDNYSTETVRASTSIYTTVSYEKSKLEEIFTPEQLEPARKENTINKLNVGLVKMKKGGEKS